MYEIGNEELEALKRVIEARQLWRYNNWSDGSPSETFRFEQEWSQQLGVSHGLAVSSGTAALICGLVGLGIEPGAEVIVPGYTFISTALAPLAIGAVPVLAEVDAGLMLDSQDVAKKISSRTQAIIPVHMMGHSVDLAPLQELARRHKLKLLEDCCQAAGGSYRGQPLGAQSDAAAFSFNFFKILTAGEGGILTTNDRTIYARARIYHDTGCAWWPGAEELKLPYFAGVNYRMDELRAAVLRVQRTRLSEILKRLRTHWGKLRAQIAAFNSEYLAPVHDLDGDCGVSLFLRVASRRQAQAFAQRSESHSIACLLPFDSGRHVYANWECLMQRRGAFHAALDPLQITKAGQTQHYTPEMLPQTLGHLERTVSIPIQMQWTDAELERTAKGICTLLKETE